jgi:hypothetical protein
MRLAFATLLCAALCACSRSEAPPQALTAPVPAEGKQVAPVTVSANITATLARLTVRFDAAAADATVSVKGLDGLELTDPPSLAQRAYAAGETVTLDVPLASTSGTLAVFVRGTYRGLPIGRAVTFALGSGAELKANPLSVIQTDEGPVKAIPVPAKP